MRIELEPLKFDNKEEIETLKNADPSPKIDENVGLMDGLQKNLPPKTEIPKMYITSPKTVKRRAFSEDALFKLMDYDGEFKPGHSYHFLSGGDIDAFSYFKYITRFRKFETALISTWCIGRQELLDIKRYLDEKTVKHFHLCLGEIFKGSYLDEYILMKDLEKAGYKIKITIFKNHAKVILAFSKPDYYFVLESSANVNTNPRTEQTTIYVDKGLYDFYKKYFDGIRSFE